MIMGARYEFQQVVEDLSAYKELSFFDFNGQINIIEIAAGKSLRFNKIQKN